MNEVTTILSALEQGDAHAAEQLLPLVQTLGDADVLRHVQIRSRPPKIFLVERTMSPIGPD